MIFGAVDSLGKNMKLASWDGRIWYPQVYDCDTTIGLDNTGFLKFDSDIEVGDPNTFNTTDSKLWSKVKLLLDDEIKAQYSLIRQNKFTLDNLFKYIVEEQMDKIPATFYNKDMQTKYLNWGSSYLYALHGRGKQQIKTWLTERLLYIDTLMGYDVSTSDYVTIRSSKLGEVYLDIETFNSMYLNVKWRNTVDNSSSQRLKVKKGEKVRFSFNMPTATDQEIRVYGGKYIKSLGDLSNLQPTTLLLAKAPGITELTCHSTNLINTDLSECTNLKRVDLSGCTQLGSGVGAQSVVDVSKCTNIQYVNCQNTQITAVKLNALGSNIREIWYPTSIQEIALSECPNLKIVGLQQGHNCKSITLINCPNVIAFGDLQWNNTSQSYNKANDYYLAGVKNLYLDNSYVKDVHNNTTLCLGCCKDITSITLKNTSYTELVFGANNTQTSSSSTNYVYDRDTLQKRPKFKLVTKNTPLTKFSILNGFTLSYSEKYGKLKRDRGTDLNSFFECSQMDLSETNLTDVLITGAVMCDDLVLPKTVKNFIHGYNGGFNKDSEILSLNKSLSRHTSIFGGGCSFQNLAGHLSNPNVPYLNGPTGMQIGSLIWSIRTSETPYNYGVYDFDGLTFDNLVIANMNRQVKLANGHDYGDKVTTSYAIDLKNVNLVAKDYNMPFYDWYKSYENITLDYSQYKGDGLCYAFAYLMDDTTNVVLPLNTDNIKYVNSIIYKANTTQIGWDFVEDIYPLISTRSDIEGGFRDAILREQTGESEAIDLINTKYKGECYYANPTGWFEGSNLKYVGRVELSTNSPSGMFRNSNVIKIGDMHFGKGATTSYYIGLRYLCMDCRSLVSVGNITIDYNNVSTTNSANSSVFQNCTNLTSIGDVRVINYPTEAPGLDFSNWFRNIGNITSIGNLQGLNYAQTVAYMFYGTKITCDLDLTPLSESILLNNMVYAFQNANATKITLPSTYKTTLGVETYSIFLGAKIGTLIFPALPSKATSLQEMFTSANIEDLTFAEQLPETVTSCNVMFNRATIGNLKMSQYIPNSVKTCTSMFKEATIGSTTMTTLPIFREGSQCTDISNMYDSYKGTVNIHSPFVVPSGVVKMPSFASYGYLPTDFVLDCSKVEYVISNRWLFTACKNLVNFTYILPKYIYADNVGNEVSDSSRFLLATDYSYNHTIDTLRSVTFDWSNYLGSNAGMYTAIGSVSSKGVIVKGINYNLFGHSHAMNTHGSPILLNDFTIHGACNSRDINLSRVRMTKEKCLKFVDEALAELDWSNRLAGATWTSRGSYKDSSLFPVKPGVTYTFDKGTENGYYGGQFSLKFYNNKQTHLSNIAGDGFSNKGTYTVFTVPSNSSICYASITLMKNNDVCTDEQLSQSTVIVGNRGYSISNSSITFTGLNNPSSISINVTDNALKPLIKSGGFIAYDSNDNKIWQGSITSSTTYPYTVTGMHGGTISKIVVTFGGLTYEQVSNAVQKGNIKVTIGDVLKTPTIYTLTLSRYTDGAGSTLSSDDQAEIISKATLKGWNVTFA